jgi:single-strand DNA-binding protein
MNNIVIIGRLGQDPELKTTQSGKQVCNFSVAVNEGYGENKKTVWFNCVLWEKTAEVAAKYLKKGSQACVRGRMVSREWTHEGVKRTAWDLVGEQLQLIDSAESTRFAAPQSEAKAYSGPEYGSKAPSRDDDVPF